MTCDSPARYCDLCCIWEENNAIQIGAAVTREDMIQSPLLERFFPGLEDFLSPGNSKLTTGDMEQVTAAAELAGASPFSDMIIFLMAVKTVVLLGHDSPKRIVPLKNFFKGYKKLDLHKNENIVGLQIPRPNKQSFFNCQKVMRRKGSGVTVCNSAIYLQIQDNIISEIHMAAGGAAPVPLYLKETCHYLTGRTVAAVNIQEAAQVMQSEIAPVTNERGAAQYKRLVMRQLLFGHFLELFPAKIKLPDLL